MDEVEELHPTYLNKNMEFEVMKPKHVGENQKKEKQERVTLSKDLISKTDSWIVQIHEKFEGVIEVTRSDLANYLIEKHSAKLTESDFEEIRKIYFDEIRLIQLTLDKVKAAKARGESPDIRSMLLPFIKDRIEEKPLKKKGKTQKENPAVGESVPSSNILTPIQTEIQEDC